MTSSPLAVAVVGAGAAGLCAARHLAANPQVYYSGVSMLMSYGENPHYVKLPIFSDLWKTQPNL